MAPIKIEPVDAVIEVSSAIYFAAIFRAVQGQVCDDLGKSENVQFSPGESRGSQFRWVEPAAVSNKLSLRRGFEYFESFTWEGQKYRFGDCFDIDIEDRPAQPFVGELP